MDVLGRILGYLRPYWRRVVLGYAALIIAVGMQLSIPRLVQYVIDNGLVRDDLRAVSVGALAIVSVGVLQGVFTYVRSFQFQYLAERIAFDIRNELYRHMLRLPFSFYDRANTGQLMSRGTEDINAIRRFLMFALRSIVQTGGTLVVITVILFTTHWRLALLSLSVMPILALTALNFGRTIRPLFLAVQQQFGVMTSVLQENLAGARVVRAFAREEDEQRKFDHALKLLYDRWMRTILRASFYFPFMTLLSSTGLALILWYGGRQVVLGNLSIGKLTAFYFYLAMLAMPIRQLGWVVNTAARAIASGERVFGVLDTVPAIASPEDATVLGRIEGRVEFENVSVRYAETDTDAISDISFVAEPGQRIALLGRPGSGKSTVTSLIPRFYDVSAGAVRIDGIDVRDVELESLRRQVGIVLQDTFLFAVSIRDNIRFGRPDATDEEVIAAATAAKAHDFIMRMPEGYDTVVGERGISLSGGQKQRIALARALVIDPRILILDDATSSVDTETEYAIQRALSKWMVGRTTFVIAHRLLTLKDADLILVLDQGRIIERGDHETLLANNGLYAEIYDLQLKDQEEFAPVAD